MMNPLESLFTKALKLGPPWMIAKVESDEGGGIIRVFIDFPRGSVFPCPACEKTVKAYDTTVKEQRHLSSFHHACYLVARVPMTGYFRLGCPGHGMARAFPFESFAVTPGAGDAGQQGVSDLWKDDAPPYGGSPSEGGLLRGNTTGSR